jgi:hypothetical protein
VPTVPSRTRLPFSLLPLSHRTTAAAFAACSLFLPRCARSKDERRGGGGGANFPPLFVLYPFCFLFLARRSSVFNEREFFAVSLIVRRSVRISFRDVQSM